MRPSTACLAEFVVVLLVACGDSSSTADQTEAVVSGDELSAPTKASPRAEATVASIFTGAPTPTPKPEPLSESEELDESSYFDNAVTFAIILEGHFGVSASSNLTQSISKGLFQVSVVRGGPYTISGKASGDEQFFRLDLKIENVGSENGLFAPDAMVLIDEEDNQYALQQDASERVLDLPREVGPGTTQRGHILFPAIPENVSKFTLTFKLGSDETNNPYEFEYGLELQQADD